VLFPAGHVVARRIIATRPTRDGSEIVLGCTECPKRATIWNISRLTAFDLRPGAQILQIALVESVAVHSIPFDNPVDCRSDRAINRRALIGKHVRPGDREATVAAICLRMSLVLSFLMLAGSLPLATQTQFASLTGRIASTDGRPLSNAEVIATNVATEVVHSAKSNEEGLYVISALPIGTYWVRAEAQGFQSSRTNPIQLESGQNARVDLTMRMGFAQTIEVIGVTPILQTEDAVVGEVLSETTIRHMPLNGRNFSQLSLLLPGVSTPDPNSFTEPKNTAFTGRPYVNGQREQGNNYLLDGVDMNDAIDNLLPTSRVPTPWPKCGSTRTTIPPSSATSPAR
jgi:hypothetical protein